MSFKMKGFSGFKNTGSSPVKQTDDTKAFGKRRGYYTRNKKGEIIGKQSKADKIIIDKYTKRSNVVDKAVKYGYRAEQIHEAIDQLESRGSDYEWKVRSSRNQKLIEYPKKVPKAPKASIASKVGKVATKVGKIVAPLGVAATLYDFYKSGQEHSGGKVRKDQKPFMTETKKKTQSIFKI